MNGRHTSLKYTFMRSSWRSDVPLYLRSISVLLIFAMCGVYIHARAVKAMLAGDVLPERSTYLIALFKLSIHALTSLAVDDHVRIGRFEGEPVHITQHQHDCSCSKTRTTDAGHAPGATLPDGRALTISRMPGILAVL